MDPGSLIAGPIAAARGQEKGSGVAIVETRVSVWEALAGRAPGQPLARPTRDCGRRSPSASTRRGRSPVCGRNREADLVSARGVPYTMLRSPDGRQACYLRLAPEEVQLTRLMDGTRTLARLVAEFARISGRLAPDQVRRVVADLAGNRMLEELPVDAFRPLQRVRRKPWPVRFGRGLLAFIQGRRMWWPTSTRSSGCSTAPAARLLFTRPAAALLARGRGRRPGGVRLAVVDGPAVGVPHRATRTSSGPPCCSG